MTVSNKRKKQEVLTISQTSTDSTSSQNGRTEGPKKTRKRCEPIILTASEWARAGQSRLTRKSREHQHQQRCYKGTLSIPPHSDHNCPHQTENFYRLIQSSLQQRRISTENEELELPSNSNDPRNVEDDVQSENSNLANTIKWMNLDVEYLKADSPSDEIMDVNEPELDSGQQERDSHVEVNLVMEKRPDSPSHSELLLNRDFPKPNSAPDLTAEMIAIVEAAMAKGPDEVVAQIGTTRITQRELSCLQEGEWLIDSIMDTFLRLITTRNEEHEGYAKVYPFCCTFYSVLSAQGGIENTRDATQNEDILSYEVILFPACVRSHWRLIVVKPQERTISAYNSQETRDLYICINIRRFMQEEEEKHGSMRSEWKITFVKNIPLQGNFNDCGPFVLTYAEYLTRRQNQFDFLQEHIPYFRKRMMYEIISGRLLEH